jgi:hypothetical protein
MSDVLTSSLITKPEVPLKIAVTLKRHTRIEDREREGESGSYYRSRDEGAQRVLRSQVTLRTYLSASCARIWL